MRPVPSVESGKAVRAITIGYALLIVIGSLYQNMTPQYDLVQTQRIEPAPTREEISALRQYPNRQPVIAVAEALP